MQFSTSEEIGVLAKALAEVQKNLKGVAKTRTATVQTRGGGSYTYRYADLPDTLEACLPLLSANGIAVVQGPWSSDGQTVTVTTVLVHESGQWIRCDLTMTPGQPGPQAMGSAITYARRYALSAMVGIAAEEDDDGQAAMPANRFRRGPAPQKGTWRSDRGAAPDLSEEEQALVADLKASIAACESLDDLREWAEVHRDQPERVKAHLSPVFVARKAELKQRESWSPGQTVDMPLPVDKVPM